MSIRIALGQINPTVGDLAGNTKKIVNFIKKAKAKKVDIIVFPELAICGYPPEDLLLKKHFVDDNLFFLKSIVKETKGITAIVGFVDRDKKNNLYSAAAIINNKKLKGVYHKMEFPGYSAFDEKRYFEHGKNNQIFSIAGIDFGITICKDIQNPNGSYLQQFKAGAQVLINLSASPYHAQKYNQRKKVLSERARKTKCFVCYVNMVGGQDDLVFDGISFVFDLKGKLIASGAEFEEELIITDIPILKSKRAKSEKLKRTVISKKIDPSKKPPIKKHITPRMSYEQEIYNALITGARDYIKKNGFKKVLIGLSGGIDSALVTTVAVDAVGRENVIGVSMPSMYSSKATQSDAKILAKNLGIKFIKIPINSIFNVFKSALSKEFKKAKTGIAQENMQARIRGNILMSLSNKSGWLVLSTGNKSETSVGYCTLYGDMVGGFNVLKDVPKQLVYRLSNFRNKEAEYNLIPRSIIKRAPSAELKPNQKDSDSLPAYPMLDQILKDYVEEDKGFEAIKRIRKHPRIIKKVIEMVDKNEYKRRQAAPGIKITPKAFGRDRRMPITNKYKEF